MDSKQNSLPEQDNSILMHDAPLQEDVTNDQYIQSQLQQPLNQRFSALSNEENILAHEALTKMPELAFCVNLFGTIFPSN